MNPYENCKIGKPRFIGFREYVIITFPNGKRESTAYYRYLMEVEIGRRLTENEIIHHKDGNEMNNTRENLEILTRAQHNTLHFTLGRDRIKFTCPSCGIVFSLTGKQYTNYLRNKNKNPNYVGPFHSAACSKIYTRSYIKHIRENNYA